MNGTNLPNMAGQLQDLIYQLRAELAAKDAEIERLNLELCRAQDCLLSERNRICHLDEQLDKLLAEREERENALDWYNKYMEGEAELDPIERLRFFLSLSLPGKAWLDVEKFIDDLPRPVPAVPEGKYGAHTQDVLYDSAYIAGAKFGWNCAVTNDQAGYDSAINSIIEERAMLTAAPQNGKERENEQM